MSQQERAMKKMRTSIKAVKKNGVTKVGNKSTNLDGVRALRGLLIDQLKDIYWAEKALVKSIPKMIRNSSSDELVKALTDHLSVTRKHVARLEEVFSVLEEKAAAVECEAMKGLIGEAQDIMEETEKGMMRDAGIIATAQKVEHYEIATYGTLSSLARNLGEKDAAVMLYETLEEEKQADEKLTEIAEDLMQVEMANYYSDTENRAENNRSVTTAKKKKKTEVTALTKTKL